MANGLDHFKRTLKEHTFRLVHVNEENVLIGLSSGFLWQPNRGQAPLLITAGHGLDLNNVMIETSYRNDHGEPLLLYAGELHIFYTNDADFAFSALPPVTVEYLQQHRDVHLNGYNGPIVQANRTDVFGFCVMNNYEFMRNDDQHLLYRYECSEVGMEVILEDRGFYYFKVDHELPPDEFYRGASGSPIANEEGYIVSILTGRSDDGLFLKGAVLTDILEHLNLPALNQ